MTFINFFTITTAGLSILIHAILIFLILRKDPKSWLNRSLSLYLFFMELIQITGVVIMLVPDPALSLFLYRSGMFVVLVPVTFYIFVRKLLKKKIPRWLIWGCAIFYSLCLVLNIFRPEFLIEGVVWSETAQFYLLVPSLLGLATALPFFLLPFFISALDLLRAYHHSKSAIERNRLKYLFLGILIIPIGFIAILIPPIRHYPTDMVMITLSGILFTYAILRYRLLDITVVIRKGLLYSILTMAVTGTYLLFSLLLQFFFPRPEAPISLPAVFWTALFVALVFQPLQTTTQHLIDRIFFRRKYNPQELVASLFQTFSETLDLDFLSTNFINLLCETLQVGKATLFLIEEKTS